MRRHGRILVGVRFLDLGCRRQLRRQAGAHGEQMLGEVRGKLIAQRFPRHDVVDHLGSRQRISYVHKMLERGTGADRQLALHEQTNDLKSVAEFIHSQFLAS